MTTSWWRCYYQEPQPLLVLREQPEVFIPLKRFPNDGDHFRWNNERWRVEDLRWWKKDAYGEYREVEAVSTRVIPSVYECPGCRGVISCADSCRVGFHRESMQASAPRPQRPRKSRSGMLDAPLQFITYREGNTERLECGHFIHYKYYKFVDRTASQRRCLECCTRCSGVQRTVKRPRIK